MPIYEVQKNQNNTKDRFNSATKIAGLGKTSEKSYNDLSQLPLINIVSSDKFSLSTQNFNFLQRTIGNQAVGQFIQAKLKIGQPGDKYEQEADRIADKVMSMPEPNIQRQEEEEEEEIQTKPIAEQITPLVQRQVEEEEEEEAGQTKVSTSDIPKIQRQEELEEEEEPIQTKRMSGRSPEMTQEIDSNISALRGSGRQPLPKSVRAFFEPRFGYDFSNVRLQTDSSAIKAAQAVKANAFTIGRNLVFGRGQYLPYTDKGKRLLAHELVHVIQQSGNINPKLQLSRLKDYQDPSNPLHDPGKLTDSEIENTNEYKAYRNATLDWRKKDNISEQEALLACRLMLRSMREGKSLKWSTNARKYFIRARKQLSAMKGVKDLENKLEWVPFSSPTAATDPSSLQSEFGKWLLAGGPEPSFSTGKINCWEVILFGAYKKKDVTKVYKSKLKGIYERAVEKVRNGTISSVGDSIESELRVGNIYTFDQINPDRSNPLPGDMVVFNRAAVHAAISLGTKDTSGRHEILSLWDRNSKKVEVTTIEQLIAIGTSTPVKYWSMKW